MVKKIILSSLVVIGGALSLLAQELSRYPRGDVLSADEVAKKWGSAGFNAPAFRKANAASRAKMAHAIIKDSSWIKKSRSEVVSTLGPPTGYFYSDVFPAYFLTPVTGKSRSKEVWQLVFYLDRDQRVSEVFVQRQGSDLEILSKAGFFDPAVREMLKQKLLEERKANLAKAKPKTKEETTPSPSATITAAPPEKYELPTYMPPIRLDLLKEPSSIISADFNEDGLLDLAVSYFSVDKKGRKTSKSDADFVSAIEIYSGDGCGKFKKTNLVTLAATGNKFHMEGYWYAGAIAVDLNRDGHVDLIGASPETNEVVTWFGKGDGTFRDRASFSTARQPIFLAGYFNSKSGYFELAVSCSGKDLVTLFRLDEKGQDIDFKQLTGMREPRSVHVTDVDGDNEVDLFVKHTPNRDTDPTIILLLGAFDRWPVPIPTPTPTQTVPVSKGVKSFAEVWAAVPSVRSMQFVDLNGDHLDDLVINQTKAVKFVLRAGARDEWFPLPAFPLPQQAYTTVLHAADWNRDGRIDLALSDNNSAFASIHLSKRDSCVPAKDARKTGSSDINRDFK